MDASNELIVNTLPDPPPAQFWPVPPHHSPLSNDAHHAQPDPSAAQFWQIVRQDSARSQGARHTQPQCEPAATVAPDAPLRYDWDEIVRHDKPGDFWIVVGDGVFDVSEWLYQHPGGAEALIASYGDDAGAAFAASGHSAEALTLLHSFKIGELQPGATPPGHVGVPAIAARCPYPDTEATSQRPHTDAPSPHPREAGGAAPPEHDTRPCEIPYAVRWLVPNGERFANFPLINDNDTQLDYWRRFGHIYAVGVPTKKWRLVVVSDPELLDEVADNTEQFGKRVEDINFFDQLAGSRGRGISVISDGDYYNRVRRVMLPWYGAAYQKTQFTRMKELARKLTSAWEAMPSDHPLDMRDWMQRYALEVSGRGACNYDFNLLEADAVKTPFATAVTESTRESIARIAEPRPDFTLFSRPAKRRRKRAYRQHNEVLFSTAETIVQGRLNTCPLGEQTDLLTRLVTVPDPESGELLDTDTIRDQILMHLSNGFNGPSITGAWLAYVLATHPEVEERLIAEIDGITGGDPDYDLQVTDLMALPYMTQVIKETLRIYPPMPITIRRSLKDGMLGRYRVRRDDIILVGALAAQRDPRYWGPQADVFDPEQFAMEKVVNRPRHAFIPFSVGQRQCMAQEVTFMMLRVALFEIYRRYRLRLAPGAKVVKNTVATTKPVAVPIIRLPREGRAARKAEIALRERPAAGGPRLEADGSHRWDQPSEIPESSAYRHLVVAYGSNFGTSKGVAERFAERSGLYGYSSELLALDDLVKQPPRTRPWLLVVMTSTYTGNPPGNAVAFKAWLERCVPGSETWANCRYLVWGLGNSQWNAFLAFPRYIQSKLAELGATPLDPLAFGDVGVPTWEDAHSAWNERVWPKLIALSGARPSEAAAARFAAEQASEETLLSTDSNTAMALSLDGQIVAPRLLTNAVGLKTSEAQVLACRELQATESPTRTRHLELSLPPGMSYAAGDHLGVCPQNEDESVARLAQRLGAALDGVFAVPRSMKSRAVPKGRPLQVRNVLTCLVDIAARPSAALLDLLLAKASAPDERNKLAEIRQALPSADGPASALRATIDAGGYDVLQLLEEFPSCAINLLEFLQVAEPLRPRYYSISSSPRIHGAMTAHITVGYAETTVPGMPERRFHGMSSHYLHSRRVGDRINIFVDQAEGFRLQDDLARPMIFVSAGTGYAPMRAFLWERLAMKRAGVPLGPAMLFNGIRTAALDYIYRDEIAVFVEEGVLDALQVATSRETPGRRDYVQDRILAQGALVWELLQHDGYVYICGSQVMRDDVRRAFVNVAVLYGALSREEAEAYMADLESNQGRYRPDVWG